MIRTKRAYKPPAAEDGARFLVDRLWPRGLTREKLRVEAWLKDAAPSHELRAWVHRDPAKWPEFKRRYAEELDAHPDAWAPLAEAAARCDVTLVFAAKDAERNNAVALRAYLERRLGDRGKAGASRARRR